jgi:hypothetical protein
MNNENWKNRSMSFDIKVDEEDARIMDQFKMLAEECDTFEKAIAERIEYLFNAHVKVDGKEKDAAYQQLLQLFSIGYQCGWNDYKSIIDERKA